MSPKITATLAAVVALVLGGAAEAADPPTATVSIAADGRTAIQGAGAEMTRTTAETLGNTRCESLGRLPLQAIEVRIRADAATPYREVLRAMEWLADCGALGVQLPGLPLAGAAPGKADISLEFPLLTVPPPPPLCFGPPGGPATCPPPPRVKRPTFVSVGAAGSLSVSMGETLKPSSPGDLAADIEASLGSPRPVDALISVRADHASAWSRVADTLARLHQAGYARLAPILEVP